MLLFSLGVIFVLAALTVLAAAAITSFSLNMVSKLWTYTAYALVRRERYVSRSISVSDSPSLAS
jgi:hypothetical protein